MTTTADAFGRAVLDWARGGTEPEVVERDDGFVEVGAGPTGYLAEFRHWPVSERRALHYVRGRVVDLGCGGGRVALHLQRRGYDVVGVDSSPLAVQASRLRGLRQALCASARSFAPRTGSFDTIVLFGNNFGILGHPDRARRTLRQWAALTAPDARILAESTDPYRGGAPAIDRAYYRRNRSTGRLPGQCRLRVRYRSWATPWFDWMFVSAPDMRRVLRDTGWHQAKVVRADPGDPYVAVLEKD